MSNHKITRSLSQPPHKPGRQSLLRGLLLGLLILPLTLTAGVYKWVDEEGKVHYGSQRPENIEAEKLKIDTARKPPAQKDPAAKDKTATEAEAKKEEAVTEPAKPEETKPPQLSRKEKKRLCGQARQRVATIESRGRLKAPDEKGNMRHLTDAERMGRLNAARADVAEYCR